MEGYHEILGGQDLLDSINEVVCLLSVNLYIIIFIHKVFFLHHPFLNYIVYIFFFLGMHLAVKSVTYNIMYFHISFLISIMYFSYFIVIFGS